MGNTATQARRFAGIIVTTAIVLAASSGVGDARAAQDGATSRISFTKLPSLQVGGMERSAFYWQGSPREATTRTCLQTSGEHIPYRISASSLSGLGDFSTRDDRRAEQITYKVTWSDDELEHSLRSSDDLTDVMRANSSRNCDNHQLSIELDSGSYDAATAGTYIDTLSLFFVIE